MQTLNSIMKLSNYMIKIQLASKTLFIVLRNFEIRGSRHIAITNLFFYNIGSVRELYLNIMIKHAFSFFVKNSIFTYLNNSLIKQVQINIFVNRTLLSLSLYIYIYIFVYFYIYTYIYIYIYTLYTPYTQKLGISFAASCRKKSHTLDALERSADILCICFRPGSMRKRQSRRKPVTRKMALGTGASRIAYGSHQS